MFQFLGPIMNGQTSVILRGTILDSTVTTYAGKTGLVFNTANLVISTAGDNEAAPTVYTTAGSTIETIAAKGTYAAPTATKCRFVEYDATNHPGLYELQFADARFAIANAKFLDICISGATGAAQTRLRVPLLTINPYSNAGGDLLNSTTINVLTNQTSFTLSAGSTVDGAYAGCLFIFQDAVTAATKGVAICSTYTGSTKGVVLTGAPTGITLAGGTKVSIMAKQAVTLSGQTLSLQGPTIGPATGTFAFG